MRALGGARHEWRRGDGNMAKLFAANFRTGLLLGCLIAVAVAIASVVYVRYDVNTLKRTIRRDAVYCGVNSGLPGFASTDEKGIWSGFDVDFCRAIAAAIFNDSGKVRFVPLDATQRFVELQRRTVDVLSRNSTYTMSREVEHDLQFAAVSYYDGQGFMVPRARNVSSALELDGAKVCVQSETTNELNVDDFFRANNMKYQAVKLGNVDAAVNGYASGQCDVLTADVSQLYALRLKMPKPGEQTILPDVISKEPLAPVVRQKDDNWHMLVKWTVYAMLNAEELGITSRNVDEALTSKKPGVMRFVGTEGKYGAQLGLSRDWAVRIIRHVGNYAEVYDRNIGAKLGIPRGLNQLWNAGGIQYAPPIR
jgi:general L-amino acid transport system substrate-binding protein